jgi:Leucine-rich repeat (LRR) protein
MEGFCPSYTMDGSLTDGKGLVLPIQMEVLCLLDSTLVGNYYMPQNGKLSLIGQLMADRSLTLVERDEQERITGTFEGVVSGSFDSLNGSWTSADGERSMQFAVARTLGSYTDYLAKWRSFPEYKDLDQALRTTHTVHQLDLGNQQLKQLPIALDSLHELLSLSLLGNAFDTLPQVVCQLLKLEDLSLASNTGIHIPPSIVQLQNLRMLILTWNGLAELPSYLGELRSLMYLDASFNGLTTIPDEFANLKNLEVLDLSFNRIAAVEQERIRAMLPWCLVKFD